MIFTCSRPLSGFDHILKLNIFRDRAEIAVLMVFCLMRTGQCAEGFQSLGREVYRLNIQTSSNSTYELKRDARQYVSATLTIGTNSYPNVGLRLKGMGIFLPLDQKPSFAIKFNKYTSGQKFLGRTKILLNSCLQDPTFVSEALANELFRDAALIAPEAGFAQVTFNGRNLGIYTMVEALNETFLKREFGDGTGNLYEGVRQGISDGLDQDNGSVTDQSDLRILAEAARLTNATERLHALDKLLDIDRFVQFVAMEMFIWHWDGYTMNRCNYRIYHDPVTTKMIFIPHGMDQTFRDPNGNLLRPINSLLINALLTTPEGRQRYHAALAKLARKLFTPESINPRLDQLAATLRPAIRQRGEPALVEWETALASFREKVSRRLTSIHRQIESLNPNRP